MTSALRIAAAIHARDGHECVYCGATKDDDQLTMDHVVPRAVFERGLASGDPDSASNLVTGVR